MSTASFTDGKLHEKEFSVWPEIEFPFLDNPSSPDLHARVFKRKFWVDPLRYVPKIANRTPRANQVLHSEAFDNAAWTKTLCAITANQYANPIDGALTADLVTENGGTGYHNLFAAGTASSSVLGNVLTVFVRQAGAHENIAIQFTDSASAIHNAVFDLSAGTALPAGTSGSTKVGSITRLPDGWFKLRLSFTAAAGAGFVYFFFGTGGTFNVSDNGSFHLFGAQLSQTVLSGIYVPTTTAARTVSCPEVDGPYNPNSLGADIFAFHVGESSPKYVNRRRAWVERTYARIPRQQIVPDVRFFTRPVLDGTKSGTAYAAGLRPGMDHIFTSRKAVTRVASTVASTIAAAMPGTNIVFTDSGAHVVNLPANSSAAAATAALAAGLTSLTGISCAAGTGWLNLVWTGTMASIVTPSGVYVAGIGGTHAELAASGNQTTPATTLFEVPSHGAVVGDLMPMWVNDALVGKATVVAVIDANNVSVMTSDLAAADSQVTHVAFSSDAAQCVLNGPKTCSIQRIIDFYHLGYTEGITTAADIPAQDPAIDPVNWLAAIIAGTTWVNIDGSELKPYQGPILQREYAQVQLSDAVQTVTP